MVDSLSQDVTVGTGTETKLASYTLDPAGRVASVTNKTNGAESQRLRYRYGDGGDSPSSIQISVDSGTSWSTTKYVSAPGVGLVAEINSAAISYHLSNPHGDSVANADTTGTIGSYAESDEYGNSIGESRGRYAWLGAHQRSADAVGGLVLMGARLYNPLTGQFLSVDPAPGGNATAYTYPQDPANQTDLDGRTSYSKFYSYSWGGFRVYTERFTKSMKIWLNRNTLKRLKSLADTGVVVGAVFAAIGHLCPTLVCKSLEAAGVVSGALWLLVSYGAGRLLSRRQGLAVRIGWWRYSNAPRSVWAYGSEFAYGYGL
jgi:RHS repeat-associated protein